MKKTKMQIEKLQNLLKELNGIRCELRGINATESYSQYNAYVAAYRRTYQRCVRNAKRAAEMLGFVVNCTMIYERDLFSVCTAIFHQYNYVVLALQNPCNASPFLTFDKSNVLLNSAN